MSVFGGSLMGMEAVTVGGRWDGAELPLPDGRLPGPAVSSPTERGIMTASLTAWGDLVVDEWCDPVVLEIGGLTLEVRSATARQAKADARLVSSYLWGAAELAHRSGAPSARERREWGAREMLTELACALRLPEGTLARRLARLTRLDALPRLAAVHATGTVSAWHVDVVLDVLRSVTDPAVLARADAFLAERVTRMTAPELRECARRWRTRNVPRTDEQRRLNLAARRVEITPADDDLCWLSALIPAAQAIAIDRRLDDLAVVTRDGGGDERSHAEVRADALVDLLLSAGVARSTPDEAGVSPADGAPREESDAEHLCGAVPEWVRGIRPEVVLTVPVLRLLGHSDEPAELEGFGPIDLDTARMLAAQASSFVRVLTHPETGAVLSVGRERYRIPEDLKRAVRLRDRTCRFPGCRRRAMRCDVDHSHAWADGGETAACNLECLCRKHHRMKHEMRWTVTHESNGTLHWHSPIGLSYWTHPDGTWPPRPAPPPTSEPPPGTSPIPAGASRLSSGYPDQPPF